MRFGSIITRSRIEHFVSGDFVGRAVEPGPSPGGLSHPNGVRVMREF